MRPLRLRLEDLSVETFATREAPARLGTVRGHESVDEPGTNEPRTCAYTDCERTCYSCPTGLGPNCCV